MTAAVPVRPRPAVLGGPAAFPDGLRLVQPTLGNLPALTRRLGRILDSGILTNGPTVRSLEEMAAARLGVGHAVAVANCTSGLMLVLQALDVRGPVVMPSFTFCASAHAVRWAGGTPVWADVDAGRFTIDPADADSATASGARAMTATHVYGAPCQVESLQRVADARGIPIVYDAAHALGSRRGDRAIGSFGTAEVFSLSPTKVVVAGEGGLVTTNDRALAETVRIGRDYGNPGDYDCLFPGLNARMSELHAAIAIESLRGLDDRIAHRNVLANLFKAVTAGVPGLAFQHVDQGDVSTYKDLTVLIDPEVFGLSVPQLATALGAEGIDTRRYYNPPIHRQKAYASLASSRALPVTEHIASRVLTVPLWSHMTQETVTAVADVVVGLHEHAAAIRRRSPSDDCSALPRPSARLGGGP